MDGEQEQDWHHVGTFKEHGRVESKKTMGFELAEQLNWKLPNVIIYPTGGGLSKDNIALAQETLGKQGISASPEGAAAYAGMLQLVEQSWITAEDEVVVFNTSHAIKYLPWDHNNLPSVKSYREWVVLE